MRVSSCWNRPDSLNAIDDVALRWGGRISAAIPVFLKEGHPSPIRTVPRRQRAGRRPGDGEKWTKSTEPAPKQLEAK